MTKALDKMCATWGFPICAISDNGLKHVTSSPYHHQGNGEAERAVRTVKKMLEQKDPLVVFGIGKLVATDDQALKRLITRRFF